MVSNRFFQIFTSYDHQLASTFWENLYTWTGSKKGQGSQDKSRKRLEPTPTIQKIVWIHSTHFKTTEAAPQCVQTLPHQQLPHLATWQSWLLSHAAVQWPSWGFLVRCPWDVSRVNAAARPSPRQRPSGFRSLGRRGFRKFHGSFGMFNSLVIWRSYLIISEHAYTHATCTLYIYIYYIHILGCNLLMSWSSNVYCHSAVLTSVAARHWVELHSAGGGAHHQRPWAVTGLNGCMVWLSDSAYAVSRDRGLPSTGDELMLEPDSIPQTTQCTSYIQSILELPVCHCHLATEFATDQTTRTSSIWISPNSLRCETCRRNPAEHPKIKCSVLAM